MGGQATSPCGNMFAAATVDGQICVWKTSQLLAVEKGKPIVRLKTDGCIYSLQSCSSYLLVGQKDKISAFDWDSLSDRDNGRHVPSWEVPMSGRGEVNSMVTCGDTCEKLVLGMGDNNVYLLDVETRGMIHVFSGHTSYVHCVDTCDNIIASGGEDGSVRLWDMKQKENIHEMKPKDNQDLSRPKLGGHVSSVAVSGDWLACGGGPAPAMWHLKSLTMASSLPWNNNEVKVVKFHDDTVMVAGRGRVLYQANISGELKAEVEMSSSVIYNVVMNQTPGVMCCAGSSSYIDICTNNYNYRDATIEFPLED